MERMDHALEGGAILACLDTVQARPAQPCDPAHARQRADDM
jgi:hypothetical protein